MAILEAALALCRAEGYASLTIEGIAARAGVGKQTVYRWWPSKGAVVLDALDGDVAAVLPIPDTGDVLADIRSVITKVVRLLADARWGPLIAALLGEAQHDPAVGSAMVTRFITPRRAPMVERLQRAKALGQLPASLDPTAVLEVIFGALYHRLLLRTGPLNAAYASFVVDLVLAEPSRERARRRAHSPAAGAGPTLRPSTRTSTEGTRVTATVEQAVLPGTSSGSRSAPSRPPGRRR